ncbi:MAG: SH3 domain-containing protein [Clostridium sp.]
MSTKNKILSILLLIFLWPIGLIILIKKKPFRKISSILIGIITFFAFFIFISAIFGSSSNPEMNSVANTASTTQAIHKQIPKTPVKPQNSSESTTNSVTSKDTSTKSVVKSVAPNDNSSATTSTTHVIKSDTSDTTQSKDSSLNESYATSNDEPVHHASPQPKETGETGTIHFDSHTKEVILHSSPGSHTGEVEHLENGTTVSILGKDRAYYHVSVDGETGYVYDRYVDLN